MSRSEINRRQFVILSSVAVAGFASGSPLLGGTVLDPRFVSVGYVPFMRPVRGVARRPSSPRAFVDASTLATGDPLFFRDGARMRILGAYRSATSQDRLDVEVLFSPQELPEPVPFFAYSSYRRDGRFMSSNSIAFSVPVESTGTVDVAIARSGTEINDRTVVSFTVNDGPSPAIKLEQGLYAIALLDGQSERIDWSSVVVSERPKPGGDGIPTLSRVGFEGSSPVDFDYVLISMTRTESVDPLDADFAVDEMELETGG